MRLAATVAYVGTALNGFQRQAGGRTVQALLEEAVFRVTGVRTVVKGAGRTDSGVHARGQVAAFTVPEKPLDLRRWAFALNANLPPDVRVLEVRRVDDRFDPQRQAIGKAYRYLLDPSPVQLPWVEPFALHLKAPVDFDRVAEALRLLEGRHDFRAFSGSAGRTKTTVRTLYAARLRRRDDGLYAVTFVGDGFLNHQCRIMVGTALEVGLGKRPPTSVTRALASGRREDAGVTAKAKGLMLMKVFYTEDELDSAIDRDDNI